MTITTEATQLALEKAAAEIPPNLLYAPDFNMEFTTASYQEDPALVMAQQAIANQRARFAAEDRQRYVAYREERYYSAYAQRDWYCWCSPGRGEYFSGQGAGGRGGEASLLLFDEMAMEYHRWAPSLPPVWEEPSKELVVIPRVELDPVEVIPAPKRSLAQRVLTGVMSFLF